MFCLFCKCLDFVIGKVVFQWIEFSPVIFSRLALYDWQSHCCCIHKQRGSNKTLMFKSHEPVVDVPHLLLENSALSHMKDVFFAEPAKVFSTDLQTCLLKLWMFMFIFLMCEVLRGLWLFANFESSRRTYAGSPVFSLFCIYTFLAGRVLSHLVLQRIFRRMPMEEPPLQMQSQVPTSMPSIQRTHAGHAILNLFNAFLHVVFKVFHWKLLDHELTI